MNKLNSYITKGADGISDVIVFDTDKVFNLCKTKRYINYAYYRDSSGKKWKTRAYNQWSAMTNRCVVGGRHQKRFKSYENTTVSDSFSNFDSWYEWALTKEGFMCVDDKGFLYQLDKDILGNSSVYSEDSCCFVPPYINGYMNTFKKFPNFKRDKEFFASVYDKEFSTLDERVLERFFEISKFNYSLDKEDRKTEQEQQEYLQLKQNNFRMDLEINKILFVKDDIYVMTGVVFNNGYYKLPPHIIPLDIDFKNSFDDVLYCVICKLNFRISRVVNIFDNLSNGDYDFINNARYDDCVNKIESLKVVLDKVISGEIKLKKWVLVDRWHKLFLYNSINCSIYL